MNDTPNRIYHLAENMFFTRWHGIYTIFLKNYKRHRDLYNEVLRYCDLLASDNSLAQNIHL